MKLILYIKNERYPHTKNHQAIQRMCKSKNIDYEESDDYERLKRNDYHILVSCVFFVNPEDIPNNIKIIMGPHFFVFPEGDLVGERNTEYSKRCVYNVLSEWNKNVFTEMVKDTIIPLVQFPFSVDLQKFKPLNHSSEKIYDCILYVKRRSNELVQHVAKLLYSKGLRFKVFKYGNYDEEEYRTALQKSKFMLTLDAHESQGFALEEAMASDVPLLLIDATSMYDEMDDGVNSTYSYLKPKNLFATSVPYWSDECGMKVPEQSLISEYIDKMLISYNFFNPREYVVRTLSDEVCMNRILEYFRL